MTCKLTCKIPGSSHNYEVEIGYRLLHNQASYLRPLAAQFAIITDDKVAKLYGEQFREKLVSSGLKVHLFAFPHGEQHKTRATKEYLEDRLLERKMGRDTCVIALGGGVVTDVAGYLAATYCRGVPLVIAPTSLLGMVDACIGGKTGVNVPQGKNLLGCIYQPKKVMIDVSTLESLPKKGLAHGVVEMIKHGLIASRQLFEDLEKRSGPLLALETETLLRTITESCRIKKEIIEQDEKECGMRLILNFGHTVGHALECLTEYSLPHGEAVAIGLYVESHISMQQGLLDQHALDRIRNILLQYGLSLQLPKDHSVEAFLEAMATDKKSLNGRPRFVMIDKIGSVLDYGASYCTHLDESLIKNALESVKRIDSALCCH